MQSTMPLVLAIVALSSGRLTAQTVPIKEESPGLRAKATLPADSAIAIARRNAPAGATLKAGELEQEHGRLIYTFDFGLRDKPGIQEIGVDARSGTVVENGYESPEQEAEKEKDDSTRR